MQSRASCSVPISNFIHSEAKTLISTGMASIDIGDPTNVTLDEPAEVFGNGIVGLQPGFLTVDDGVVSADRAHSL